jgi:splicing factor 3B subunit 3
VGDWDKTVRIFSLDPDNCLQSICVQGVPTQPESLAMVQMQSGEGANSLFLNIGLNNGISLRSVVDPVTGELSDTRTRFVTIQVKKWLIYL